MPILASYTLPIAPTLIPLPFPTQPGESSTNTTKFYIAFIASKRPDTNEAWCSDVRAALPVIRGVFDKAEREECAFVEVGGEDEWKSPTNANAFRTTWSIKHIPTLARFERVDGEVKETGRLTEDECKSEEKIKAFIK